MYVHISICMHKIGLSLGSLGHAIFLVFEMPHKRALIQMGTCAAAVAFHFPFILFLFFFFFCIFWGICKFCANFCGCCCGCWYVCGYVDAAALIIGATRMRIPIRVRIPAAGNFEHTFFAPNQNLNLTQPGAIYHSSSSATPAPYNAFSLPVSALEIHPHLHWEKLWIYIDGIKNRTMYN